jgi:integrase
VISPKITARAGLPGVRLEDLRDTFASHLLTRGVSIQFVSKQIGHDGVSVTEKHYAKHLCAGGVRLAPGELPADLLARLADSLADCSQGYVFAFPGDRRNGQSRFGTWRL